MNKEILNVLNKIENNGFVAYIVGGYVRDYLLKLPLTDVDIITNATPKDLSEIFDNIKKTYIEYGSVKLYINNQIIDITSMRKDLLYKNNKQVIDNNTLTALTLLIAESNPKEKEILVDLVMNFLKEN